MLYILAGAQIGQSPKKLEGLPSYAYGVLLLLTVASDVTWFDMFGLDKTDILMSD